MYIAHVCDIKVSDNVGAYIIGQCRRTSDNVGNHRTMAKRFPPPKGVSEFQKAFRFGLHDFVIEVKFS